MTQSQDPRPVTQEDDPAFAAPLPETKYLDEAARRAGYRDWFAVPAMLRTPENRAIIINARVLANREGAR